MKCLFTLLSLVLFSQPAFSRVTNQTASDADTFCTGPSGKEVCTDTDGNIVPTTDNAQDLGTSALEFKNLYLDGTLTTDDLVIDEELGINDSSPDAQLDIISNKAPTGYILSASSQNDTTGDILSVRGDGRVGIGVASPTYQLHISSSIGITLSTGTVGVIYAGTFPFIHANTSINAVQGYNFYAGVDAGNLNASANSTGNSGNVGIGYRALKNGTAGGVSVNIYNTAVGTEALYNNSEGWANTAIGWRSMTSNTLGNQNVAVGDGSLSANVSGSSNCAVGTASLYSNETGGNNSAFGWTALELNVGGSVNSAFGVSALRNNVSGEQNTAAGYASFYSNTTAGAGSGFGRDSFFSNSTGEANSCMGHSCFRLNTVGSHNTGLGYFAGHTEISANSNVSGSSNTYIGFRAGPGTATQLTNSGCIGANCRVTASNAFVLGSTVNAVNVGIGVTNPAVILDVTSTTQGLGVPVLTSAQVAASTPGRAGAIIYNSTLSLPCISTGTTIMAYSRFTGVTTCQ